MKKFTRRLLGFLLIAVLALSAIGCSSSGDGSTEAGEEGEGTSTENAQGSGESAGTEGEKIVNVGVTDSLGGVNPFVVDQTEINKYAMGLMFLPLMELDKDLNFQGMLADSVTTEDK